MNIITDHVKLRYRLSNNSGSINKEFGNDQQAAYDFANEIKETAIILRTQALFSSYGQIGYQVFVYDRERHVATFTYDWEKQQIKFSNN